MRVRLHLAALGLLLLGAAAGPAADLARVKSESNLEKRSKLALEHAQRALKDARSAYEKGDHARLQQLIGEIRESVDLAEASLEQTGKDPRRRPKWFKRAEIATRDLLRKLDAFQQEMSVTDRELLEPLESRIQEVHDDLLRGIMEGKRK